jgi:hypothetical protein
MYRITNLFLALGLVFFANVSLTSVSASEGAFTIEDNQNSTCVETYEYLMGELSKEDWKESPARVRTVQKRALQMAAGSAWTAWFAKPLGSVASGPGALIAYGLLGTATAFGIYWTYSSAEDAVKVVTTPEAMLPGILEAKNFLEDASNNVGKELDMLVQEISQSCSKRSLPEVDRDLIVARISEQNYKKVYCSEGKHSFEVASLSTIKSDVKTYFSDKCGYRN